MPPLSLVLSLVLLAFRIVDELPAIVADAKAQGRAAREPDSPGGEAVTVEEFGAIVGIVAVNLAGVVAPTLADDAPGLPSHLVADRHGRMQPAHIAPMVTTPLHAAVVGILPTIFKRATRKGGAVDPVKVGRDLADFLRPHLAHLVYNDRKE